MGTVNPRPRGGSSLGEEIRKRRLDTEQHRRLLNNIPKPVTPVSGSIVDIAGLQTSGVVGLPWPSGRFDLDLFGVTYDSPTSMVDGSAVDWLTVSGSDISPTEEGFYLAWCHVKLVWNSQAEAPGTSLSLYLNGRNVPSSPMFSVIDRGSAWGVEKDPSNGPEWMTPDDYWRLEADGTAASSGDIASSSAVWRITKFA